MFALKLSQMHTQLYAYRSLIVSTLICCFSPLAIAHTDLTDHIDVLSHKINHNPDSPDLYMERGKAFRLRGDYRNALKDFQFVEKLDPKNVEAKYQQGLVLLKLGQSKKALAMFDYVLTIDPMRQLALMNRARVFRNMGDYENAAIDYQRALNMLVSPKPGDYMEIANNYVEYGKSHYSQALAVLDVAINNLGVLVQLQLPAIDIDLSIRNYQSALKRVDSLLATLKRKEKSLVKKAEILLLMGKQREARDSYRLALKSIAQLPTARRNVEAIKNLEVKIRKALVDLNSGQVGQK